MKCEKCGSDKGHKTIDPYLQDVHNEEVEVVLCKQCYDFLVDEI